MKEKRFAAIAPWRLRQAERGPAVSRQRPEDSFVGVPELLPREVHRGPAIRKYAEAHQLSRGGMDYLQKKFFSALAQLLKERDEGEGRRRLRKPVEN